VIVGPELTKEAIKQGAIISDLQLIAPKLEQLIDFSRSCFIAYPPPGMHRHPLRRVLPLTSPLPAELRDQYQTAALCAKGPVPPRQVGVPCGDPQLLRGLLLGLPTALNANALGAAKAVDDDSEMKDDKDDKVSKGEKEREADNVKSEAAESAPTTAEAKAFHQRRFALVQSLNTWFDQFDNVGAAGDAAAFPAFDDVSARLLAESASALGVEA